ncbi:MAG TPA: MFS transporter, partial [Tepidiformaceae bacterium]|nr:MFS transporter [Tepidiformaceae bacterium]
MRSRPFLVLYLSVFVAVMGISMVTPLLPVYAEELGATGVWIGLTFSIFAVTQAFTSPFVGRLSDKFGRKTFIVAGLLVYFTGAIGYLTADSFYQVLGFRALSGLGTSLIFSCARAYIGDMAPRGQEGRWFGVFATADIVGFGIGPMLAGLLRETSGFDSVFIGMATLMGVAAVIVVLFLPRNPPVAYRVVEHDAPEAAGLVAAFKDRLVLALTLNMVLISLSMGATLSFLAVKLEDNLGAAPLIIGVAFAVQNFSSGVSQPIVGRLADTRSRRVLICVGLSWAAIMLVTLGAVHSLPIVFIVLVGMGIGSALSQVTGGAMQVVAGRRV